MIREATGFSWPTLLFTFAGLWLAAYAVMRAFDEPARTWDNNNSADAAPTITEDAQ